MRRLVCGTLLLAACTTAPADSLPVQSNGSNAPPVTETASGDSEGLTCWANPIAPGPTNIAWTDATDEFGLIDPLAGMHAHAAAWGDVDGDLRPDAMVGTFADRPDEAYAFRGASGPAPDRLLSLGESSFTPLGLLDGAFGRTSGSAFADLDLDGDLDLVVARNVRDSPRGSLPTMVYENLGGTFSDGTVLDPDLGGRSIAVIDGTGDGLPDLFIAEDRWSGGGSRFYRNDGSLGFTESTAAVGLPLDVHGLGVAVGDLDGDRLSDLVVAGSNRVFAGTGSGFREVPADSLQWDTFGPEDDVSGASLADVDRDGRLDLVLGHHYGSTIDFDQRVPVRLYRNVTEPNGQIGFEDVTATSGLVGLSTKAPHVQFADLDNDGWIDLVTSASARDGTEPAVFRNAGTRDAGFPTFEAPDGLGDPQYWVSAPAADLDRDGRLDVLAVEWEPSLPSRLFLNTSDSGHWLSVSVGPELGGGVGTLVEVFDGGGTGGRLGSLEITATTGYTAGVELHAHFGLGAVDSVRIVVTPPLPHDPIVLERVGVDRHVRVPGGC